MKHGIVAANVVVGVSSAFQRSGHKVIRKVAATLIITICSNQEERTSYVAKRSMITGIRKVCARREGRRNQPPLAATKEDLVKTEVSQRQRTADAVTGGGKVHRATTVNPQCRRSCAAPVSGK